jgi:hypothetical protein
MPNKNLLSHSRSKTKNGSSGGSQSSLSEPYAPTNGVPDPKSTIWQEINNRPANVTGSGKMLDNVTGAVSTLHSNMRFLVTDGFQLAQPKWHLLRMV